MTAPRATGRPDGEAVDPLCHAMIRVAQYVSEEWHRAGWDHDLEYRLWEAAAGVRGGYDRADVAALKQLAGLTGHWFAWDDETGDPVPVPMGEWVRRYRAWPWRTGSDAEPS